MPPALPRRARLLIIGLIAVVAGSAEPLARPSRAADTPAQDASIEGALIGAKPLGEGAVNAYAKGEATLLLLPKLAFERPFLCPLLLVGARAEPPEARGSRGWRRDSLGWLEPWSAERLS